MTAARTTSNSALRERTAQMGMLFGEPILVLVAGGGAILQALLATLVAFGVPITQPEQTAVTALVTVVLGVIARAYVTPVT